MRMKKTTANIPDSGQTAVEQSLRNSELRYRRLFESAQDGILIVNAETGSINDVNPYLIDMLGYSREEFVEKKLWEVGAFKDIKASRNSFLALQKNEFIRYENLPLKTKGGRLVQVEFVSNVYLVGNEKVIQCNVRDISDRKGYAGRAALERSIVHIPDLAKEHDNFLRGILLAGEGFVSYYGVPLIAKGQVMGVLEVFQRIQLVHDNEWLDFLKALAAQAAIAIENVTLFDNLQRSNTELFQAYDATIEGWSRALELRDNETEGHTQRAADLTVKLARLFGLSDAELVQVRWGALLHDIGKMGIPDKILFKRGTLTEAEWVVMKKHTIFAHEMLSPIRYLRLALDIPCAHHEKWDGTGYPFGLKGEQIPLVARIFAVVDVWDALRSDRLYHASWSVEKVREHLRSLAGTHFDPHVVNVCLDSEFLTC
jgi:PAS domain S-box-containing protein/putative nucleotidyltransferase with HDIG domain